MNNEIAKQVLGYIESFGEVVNSGAKYGFEIMVKQQFTSGLIDVLTSIPVTLLLIFLMYKVTFLIKRKWDNIYSNDLEPFVVVGYLACLIALIIFSFAAFFATVEGIKMMINPEFYAIKEILDTFKK